MKMIKIVTLSLLSMFFNCSFAVAAWSTLGHNFNGGIKFEGNVTNNRNPWQWKIMEKVMVPALNGNERREGKFLHVPISQVTILSGKTSVTSPAGRQGLTPVVRLGKTSNDNRVQWTAPGIATVTLPVYGEEHEERGIFTFKIRAVALMKHVIDGKEEYFNLYNDTAGNGLPDSKNVIERSQASGFLREIFKSEPLKWLDNDILISEVKRISAFSDKAFRQINGAYGAQIVPNSGELTFSTHTVPAKWRVTLPISIEYQ
ncbi:TPA: hypothetical protein PRY54_003927 [Escherichia coli]|uniref:F4 family fimbrial subunit n=1 Tax=Salmonella enterica TaxID=28901 RepID=UPI00175196CC|nr:hypothetical protein [Salmonella enterica]MBS9213432.1 hypothetical protein [Escherichia coli]HAI6890245.1 hypothetical protein [Escherichia coli]HDK2666225.1 hypothetical protein [Escherichia coli]